MAIAQTARATLLGKGDDLGLLADGAGLARGPAGARGRPAQLGVGVTDVEARQPSLAELGHDLLAREPVVDDGDGAGIATSDRLRAESGTLPCIVPEPRV